MTARKQKIESRNITPRYEIHIGESIIRIYARQGYVYERGKRYTAGEAADFIVWKEHILIGAGSVQPQGAIDSAIAFGFSALGITLERIPIYNMQEAYIYKYNVGGNFYRIPKSKTRSIK